jgi:hypothetical protein
MDRGARQHLSGLKSMPLDANTFGLFPIAPTPFHPDGRMDEGSIDTLVERYLAAGANGVTVLGIMGEAPKLEPDGSLEIAARFIDRMGKLPVIIGVSAPGFAAMRSLARSVMDQGAAGVMIAPQPALRTDDQITGYYRQAVEAIGTDIPFVIQDYPLTLTVPDDAESDPADHYGKSVLRDAEARGLARTGKNIDVARLPEGRLAPSDLNSDRQRRIIPGFRNGAWRGRRDDGLCLSGDAGRRGQAAEGRQAGRGPRPV